MKKRIFAMLLVALLLSSTALTGCGNGGSTTDTTGTANTTPVETV